MVSTRSHDNHDADTGDKRTAEPAPPTAHASKRHKVDKVVAQPKRADDGEGSSTGAAKEQDKAQPAAEEEQQGAQGGGEDKGGEQQAGDEKKGDETKTASSTADEQSSTAKPDGMGEAKRDEEPQGDVVEHKAGPGEALSHAPKVNADRKHGIIEKGYVYFIFRPKVETEHPESLDDVARFHLLLSPEGEKIHRLIVIGKKALPEAGESSRPIWGQVDGVADDLKQFKDGLAAYTYETKTMGTRHQPGARVAAAGAYVLHTTEHPPENSSNASAVYHTHFAYEIAVPHDMGEVQKALHLQHEGSFTLQVKNFDSASTNPTVGNQPESKHPQFPPELKHLFTTKFIPANPPSLLNYPGAELLLVPSKHTAKEDIGDAAEKELDDEDKALEKEIDQQEGGGSEAKKVLKEMGFEGLQGAEALQGHWE
ncbi:uncharacterized protein RHOBADRAFT_51593 [Rhodotorula graminis WP1]|uniref:Uncharacterized protein n=1 Tax=Rhodotorula graminis (strain WP1) TaxID=578459 RepID=A0A194SAN3_RHOGW|nr:uncharacterized protein RHOBADRAFT_51593 [Rhodotorula graminis WP1]KPV77783.1 hypothetical protein RHOBADRAFT_51593 [Rhodotorula graminis WP1]